MVTAVSFSFCFTRSSLSEICFALEITGHVYTRVLSGKDESEAKPSEEREKEGERGGERKEKPLPDDNKGSTKQNSREQNAHGRGGRAAREDAREEEDKGIKQGPGGEVGSSPSKERETPEDGVQNTQIAHTPVRVCGDRWGRRPRPSLTLPCDGRVKRLGFHRVRVTCTKASTETPRCAARVVGH